MSSASSPFRTADTHPQVRLRREQRYRPQNGGVFHIMLRITAPSLPPEAHMQMRAPLDVAFVLDRSGSMSGGAFDLARDGALHAMQRLQPIDSLSVTVYDDRVDLLLSQRWHGPDAIAKAQRRLGRVGPRGSTDLGAGWLCGVGQLAPLADGHPLTPQHPPLLPRLGTASPQRRVLLLTDGFANVGITDVHELGLHAANLAACGVTTSTFGVGAAYDEVFLATLADAGQGRFHHMVAPWEIPAAIAAELDDLLELVMLGLIVQLTYTGARSVRLLNSPTSVPSDTGAAMRIGDLSAGETRTLIWEVTLPPAAEGQREALEVALRWTDPRTSQSQQLTQTDVLEARRDAGPVDADVARALAPLLIAQRRAEILERNRVGDFAGAQALLQATRRDAGRYANPQQIETLLDGAQVAAAAPLPAAEFKRQYAGSRNQREGRQRPLRA